MERISEQLTNLMEHLTRCNLKDVVPCMLMLPITLLFLASLILFLMPRLIINCFTWWLVFKSKFTRKYVKLDKNTWCSYLERGTLDSTIATVVCLHGFTGSGTDFVPMEKYLSGAYHVVAIDYLNHGKTTKYNRIVTVEDNIKFIKMFIEKTGLHRRKFHLIGYSLGGCIATTYTATYPEDVASLILCSPFIREDEGFIVYYNNEKNFFPKTRQEFREFFTQFLGSGKMEPLPTVIVTALMDHKKHVLATHRLVGDGHLTHVLTPELLKKIPNNVLIVWGEADQLLPAKKGAEYLKENLQSAHVEYIKDGSHLMQMTHEKEMVSYITKWLPEQTVQPVTPKSQGFQKEKS